MYMYLFIPIFSQLVETKFVKALLTLLSMTCAWMPYDHKRVTLATFTRKQQQPSPFYAPNSFTILVYIFRFK